ncbi:response regulator [Spirulina subsalsa]|uniref:response regulator n=1 Tax=Spirulina subsalsa TaxID=54311 RepID=UPI000318D91E|nr:response regulator [Spirulina subsalsa]
MKSQAKKKPKILVVDDEPDNLDLLYRTFHREYKVLRATSGPTALEILEQESNISVIISDQRMPIMTGTEFLSLTAMQYPDIIRILLTGYTDVEDLVEAINSGKVFKYVTKPWEATTLKEIVKQALDTHNVLKIRTEELSRSLKRETLLNSVTNTIRNAQFDRLGDSPLREVLQTVVNTVGDVLNVDICLLRSFADHELVDECFIYQKALGNSCVREAVRPTETAASEEKEAASLTITEPPPWLKLTVWETQQVEVINDIQSHPHFQGESSQYQDRLDAFARAKITSTLMVPLICQRDLMAVLALHRCGKNQGWEEDESQLAGMVADQAALAISQARAYEKVQALAKRETLVNTITSAIRSTLDPQEIFMAITEQLGTSLEVDGCALSLWTEDDEFVQCVGLYDRHSERVDASVDPALTPHRVGSVSLPQSLVPIAGNPVLLELLHTKQPVVVEDMVAATPDSMKGVDLPIRAPARALLIVPLLVDGRIIGSISLRQTERPRHWSGDDIELSQAVASQAAIAVQQSRLYQKTRQQAERLLELDRQKTEFFQNISHEFRTPLTLMIGPLESAINKQQGLPYDQAQIALRNSRRLLRLVNQLLDLQRLDAGRMQPKFRPCDLQEFVEQIVDTFRPYCQKKGIQLNIKLESCRAIYLDSEKFDKVLYNLLSNAMKFTDPGGKITVSLKLAGDHVTLQVTDTGIGIAASQIPYLFDRFRQAEGSVNRSYEGTGLGLALVKEIVELHGGQVMVNSVKRGEESEGQISGTTFSIWLQNGSAHLPPEQVLEVPTEIQAARSAVELADLEAELLEADEARAIDTIPTEGLVSTPETLPSLDPNQHRVLVVDDNPDLRTYVSHILSSAGYQVTTARNGAEGFQLLKQQRPELVISDLMMPKVSGLDLIRMVRNEEELRGTPIILLTAKADEASRLEGTEQGADSYLSKPFNDRELLASVRNLLSLKENEARVKQINDYLTESVLKRFLPPEMVKRAAKGEMELDLHPDPRLVTILFSDIVGFTQLSNRLQARGIAQVLNEYLEAMTQVVFEHGGTVDKFMGDAIIALFGAPEDLPPAEQVRRAVNTARGMYRRLDDLNAYWERQGIVGGQQPPPVQFRCGIHHGPAVVGMFGGNLRSDYTAIGPSVNIAARLQEATHPNSILVSTAVTQHLSPSEVEEFGLLQLKGIDGKVLTFLVKQEGC